VTYVWFDALVNYISALGWPENTEQFEKFWGIIDSPKALQVAGKDNLRQQSSMWQAMLLSAGLPPSRQIMIHGFIASGGQKMSKSLGNVVSPFAYVEEFGADALRYYLLREIPTLDDGDFTREKFLARYNADLANGLGNLVQRVTTMVQKYVGALHATPVQDELQKNVDSCIQRYQLDQALVAVWEKIAECDKRVDTEKPWVLAKDPAQKEKLEALLSGLIADIRDIGVALTPFLPQTAGRILDVVDAEKINPPTSPLFPRK
jgi:methionyl-tRNA synthetase